MPSWEDQSGGINEPLERPDSPALLPPGLMSVDSPARQDTCFARRQNTGEGNPSSRFCVYYALVVRLTFTSTGN